MATPAFLSHPGPDFQVSVKVLYNDNYRRFKLPLKDLQASVFSQKASSPLRLLLGIPASVNVIFERYSDSAASYIQLDEANPSVYKQLYRAAKAKSKLRIRATVADTSASGPPAPSFTQSSIQSSTQSSNQSPSRHSYLETVLSSPAPILMDQLDCATNMPELATTSAEVDAVSTQPTEVASTSRDRLFEVENRIRFPTISHSSPNGMFCIDCNHCGRSIANEHYHCSICESGDYDLCPECVEQGTSCRSDSHWLIKRMVVDGIVTNSTTETIPPRRPQLSVPEPAAMAQESQPESQPEIATCPADSVTASGSTTEAHASLSVEQPICNGCCRDVDESNLVRCNECEDYDLCLRCLLHNKHGHHPAHTFSLGTDRNFCLKNLILSRCLPGRQFKHAALCDGCDKPIMGTRHKCLSCPDWDYCSTCIQQAGTSHPRHRFAPIYESLGDQPQETEVHFGVYCDGPLCNNKPGQNYIVGVRYKCAVCDDLDFCASCEAHPTNQHNVTHPLVKFKTHVRAVSIDTITDYAAAARAATLSSQLSAPATAPTTAKSEVVEKELPIIEQTPVEVEASKPELASGRCSVEWPIAVPAAAPKDQDESEAYKAHFVRDTVADGTKLPPKTVFQQTWTLVNAGCLAWPVGTDVRFVGGDTMFNVDSSHPSSVESIRDAMESTKLAAPVEPGQCADFSVTLCTPQREGTAISYWRMKLPNGVPIGHRLWCDVQVQATTSSSLETAGKEIAEKEVSVAVSEPTGSGMIFPKLEKESPEASLHEATNVSHEAPNSSAASELDVLEDVESLTLDEASTDAGFLTDEEYDVLDASDHDFAEAKQSMQ
ncbi:hypothetical protein N7539_009105 [Penicillium diatomitis]|uniref:ZZ-type domain-containing protein n=1 Tax=Penicillium diatomitis TaxID=2819901 RepID=A0A9W9WLP6_9EURO|nr:uncharacterized protein N7539_009105 [Penicillium diatomitis]KAJ5469487.1 hypothetical protein N7539_009105 [Penicillium diatomitis]